MSTPGEARNDDAGALVAAPAQAAAALLFGALTRLRGRRIVHPDGVGFDATVRVAGGAGEFGGVPLFEARREHSALVRLSRGTGVPEPLPDVLGLALRLLDAHGPGHAQDFLLVTAGSGALVRHLPLPGPRGFFRHHYSTLLLYRAGTRAAGIVGASALTEPRGGRRGSLEEVQRAVLGGPVRFELTFAAPTGSRDRWAVLELGRRLPDEEAEALAFNPWHTGDGIRPVGPLMGLRRGAYAGSQAARGADPGAIEAPAPG